MVDSPVVTEETGNDPMKSADLSANGIVSEENSAKNSNNGEAGSPVDSSTSQPPKSGDAQDEIEKMETGKQDGVETSDCDATKKRKTTDDNDENSNKKLRGENGDRKDVTLKSEVLPRFVAKFLDEEEPDLNSKKVYSDHDYFNALLAVETCRAMAHSLDEQSRVHYFKLDGKNLTPTGKAISVTMEQLFRKLEEKLQLMLQKMEKMNQRPLLEKFLDNLEATPEEKQIFRFVICMDMMPMDYFDNRRRRPPLSGGHSKTVVHGVTTILQEIFGIDSLKIMNLLSADSIWVKEQLYYHNAQSVPPTMLCYFSTVTGQTLAVLQGYEVTQAMYKSLKSTVLEKTLLEHPPFCESEAGKNILKRQSLNKDMKKQKSQSASNGSGSEQNALAMALKTSENGKSDIMKGIKAVSKNANRERLFDALALSTKSELTQKAAEVKDDNGQKKQITEADSAQMDVDSEKMSSADKKESDGLAKKGDDEFGPYDSDLTYLEDQVRALMLKEKMNSLKRQLDNVEEDHDDADELLAFEMMEVMLGRPASTAIRSKSDSNSKFQKQKKLDSIKDMLSQLQMKIDAKMHASLEKNGKVFRLEQLCQALQLEDFEKSCILYLLTGTIMPAQSSSSRASEGIYSRSESVGALIGKLCVSLEDKMKCRRFFYKSSTLIEEGILTLSGQDFMTDLNMCTVQLDRRLFDFIVGLDTEMSELVDGSHLYKPDISVDDCVLLETTKKRIIDAVSNFDKVKEVLHGIGMDKKISYGLGQVLLFYGAPGTGKTMLANAVASKLGMKVLLVNFPSFGTNSSSSIIKFIFREARINRSLLFFDECESLFLSREKGGRSINMILTELERFDGVCILATNRAFDLDEAMHRRISLSVEFKKPDHIMREKIWKALKPPKLPVDENVDFSLLAKKYELVGGTVKNAWIQSIQIMIQRSGKSVSQEDLNQAASEQVRGQLCMEDFDRRVVPTNGIDTMVLDKELKESLNSIVHYSKAQSVLFGQWGFDKIHRSTTGISVMFHGVPGTGKTMAAEAIGFDLGKALLVVNVAELVSKWVGETGKNIDKIFAQAKSKDAILVFDEAEGLFGSRASSPSTTSRHDTLNVGLLLQYIENFSGICIVITNMKDVIDEAFFRRFRFVLEFKQPSAHEREMIWKSILPKECPVASDVDFGELARRFGTMSGGGIKNALLRAATAAALRDKGKNVLTMKDLTTACEAEENKMGNKTAVSALYS